MSALDFLTPAQLVAGPRRVMVTPDRPQGYVICDKPVNRIPYLDGPTDQEVEDASAWLRWMLNDPRRMSDPSQETA